MANPLAGAAYSTWWSPSRNGKRPSYSIPVSTGSRSSSCGRWLRWLFPMLLGSLLSSYATYILLYSSHTSQGMSQHDSKVPAHPWQQQQHHRSRDWWHTHQTPSSANISSGATAGAASSQGSTTTAPAAGAGQHPIYAPKDAALQWVNATGRRMRVALVNDAPYHLEIVAGFLHVLSTLPVDVTWYQAGQTTADGTLNPIELLDVTGFIQLLGYLPLMKPSTPTPDPCDFAILVSPEYFLQQTQAFLAAAKPITAVVLAHNGMNRAVQRIQSFHQRLHFAALSPHVAAAARHVLHLQHTHWMLPTFPFSSKTPCTFQSPDATSCMEGFSIQGNFESARRNYTRLWLMVQQSVAAGTVPTQPPAKRFHLHLVGRGNVSTLQMPAEFRDMVTLHVNLRFPQYYDQLQHTHALLMLLGNINYLLQKMSSTVVSSLMTGVPIIADARVLDSYSFLKPEHVFFMEADETEMDVMQRILRMSPAEVFAVRQRVLDLAMLLNKRTRILLQNFMPRAEDASLAPPVV